MRNRPKKGVRQLNPTDASVDEAREGLETWNSDNGASA